MRSQHPNWRLGAPAFFASTLALTACQSPPPPTTALDRARTAIQGAQQDGAQQLAPAQLQSAQSKLSGAQAAVSQKDMDQAKYLAEEAEMEGINAEQVALAQKAVNAQNELQRAQPTLRKSMEQTQEGQSAPPPRQRKQRTQNPQNP